MKLELLMTYHATLKPSQPIGRGPYGNRQIAEVIGGRFEGARLQGEVLTCGGDWILVDDTGIGHLAKCRFEEPSELLQVAEGVELQ